MKSRSLRVLAAATAFAAFAISALPARAAQFVQDGAGMFSASAVAQLDERLSAFNTQTGKEIVVVTTPSLNGATLQSAADSAFSQQGVNGVLIFIARNDRRDMIVPDRAGVQAGWFTSDALAQIRTTMEDQFKAENYDAGITGAVGSLLQIYRAHLGSLQQSRAGYVTQGQPATQGVHISMFWWIVILVAGFLILRSVMRAVSAQRYYGNVPPPGGAPPPGAGYGPGYGSGYGYGGYGGGGSFWSGLLGGLGGAWLGNELFRGGGGGIGGAGGAAGGAIAPADGGSPADAGGWQSDPGQAGAGSGGDWSGGGFGSDFGGGDSGGGDSGGGGGDSGGGW